MSELHNENWESFLAGDATDLLPVDNNDLLSPGITTSKPSKEDKQSIGTIASISMEYSNSKAVANDKRWRLKTLTADKQPNVPEVLLALRIRPLLINDSTNKFCILPIVENFDNEDNKDSRIMLINPTFYNSAISGSSNNNMMLLLQSASTIAHNIPEWAKVYSGFDNVFWSTGTVATNILERNISQNNECYNVFHAYTTQRDIYDTIGQDMINNVFIHGSSTLCFGYGRTGSGKTHTLFGSSITNDTMQHIDNSNNNNSSNTGVRNNIMGNNYTTKFQQEESIGLVPRVYSEIVKTIVQHQQQLFNATLSTTVANDTKMTLSFYEVYNDKIITDLLSTSTGDVNDQDIVVLAGNNNTSTSATLELKVREHPVIGPYVDGLNKIPVISIKQLLSLMNIGLNRRHESMSLNEVSGRRPYNSANNMSNRTVLSCRSHAVICLELMPSWQSDSLYLDKPLLYNKISDNTINKDYQVIKVQFVELAGSEPDFQLLSNTSNMDNSSGVMSKLQSSLKQNVKAELKSIRQTFATLNVILKAMMQDNNSYSSNNSNSDSSNPSDSKENIMEYSKNKQNLLAIEPLQLSNIKSINEQSSDYIADNANNEDEMPTTPRSTTSTVNTAVSNASKHSGVTGSGRKQPALVTSTNANKSVASKKKFAFGSVVAGKKDAGNNNATNSNINALPYRNSLLTWLLKDCLCPVSLSSSSSKCSKVYVLATLSPSIKHYSDTLHSVLFMQELVAAKQQRLLPYSSMYDSLPNASPNSKVNHAELTFNSSNIRNIGITVTDTGVSASTASAAAIDGSVTLHPNYIGETPRNPNQGNIWRTVNSTESSSSSGGNTNIDGNACNNEADDTSIINSNSNTIQQLRTDLGADKKGTSASRKFLQLTVADPRQRLAKLTGVGGNYSNTNEKEHQPSSQLASNTKKSPRSPTSSHYDTHHWTQISKNLFQTSAANSGKSDIAPNEQQQQTSANRNSKSPGKQPISAVTTSTALNNANYKQDNEVSRRVNSVTDSPMRNIPALSIQHSASGSFTPLAVRDTYRELHSRLVEMQIELQNTKTDRDSLRIELLGSKEYIDELENKLTAYRMQLPQLLENDQQQQLLKRKGSSNSTTQNMATSAMTIEDKYAKMFTALDNIDKFSHGITNNTPDALAMTGNASSAANMEKLLQNILYLKSIIMKKEDDIEKLLQNVREERRLREKAEKQNEIQMLEFLQRVDGLRQLSDEGALELKRIHDEEEQALRDQNEAYLKELTDIREMMVDMKINLSHKDKQVEELQRESQRYSKMFQVEKEKYEYYYNKTETDRRGWLEKIKVLENQLENQQISQDQTVKPLSEKLEAISVDYTLLKKENEMLLSKYNNLQTEYTKSKASFEQLNAAYITQEILYNKANSIVNQSSGSNQNNNSTMTTMLTCVDGLASPHDSVSNSPPTVTNNQIDATTSTESTINPPSSVICYDEFIRLQDSLQKLMTQTNNKLSMDDINGNNLIGNLSPIGSVVASTYSNNTINSEVSPVNAASLQYRRQLSNSIVNTIRNRIMEGNLHYEELIVERSKRQQLELEYEMLQQQTQQLLVQQQTDNGSNNSINNQVADVNNDSSAAISKLQSEMNKQTIRTQELESSVNHWKQLAQNAQIDLAKMNMIVRSKENKQALESNTVSSNSNNASLTIDTTNDTSSLKLNNKQLQAENTSLVKKLNLAINEAETAKEKQREATLEMQQEFASMWVTVQQLTKLDETRQKSLRNLSIQRDELQSELTRLERQLEAVTRERNQLSKELQEIDADLILAATESQALLPLELNPATAPNSNNSAFSSFSSSQMPISSSSTNWNDNITVTSSKVKEMQSVIDRKVALQLLRSGSSTQSDAESASSASTYASSALSLPVSVTTPRLPNASNINNLVFSKQTLPTTASNNSNVRHQSPNPTNRTANIYNSNNNTTLNKGMPFRTTSRTTSPAVTARGGSNTSNKQQQQFSNRK